MKSGVKKTRGLYKAKRKGACKAAYAFGHEVLSKRDEDGSALRSGSVGIAGPVRLLIPPVTRFFQSVARQVAPSGPGSVELTGLSMSFESSGAERQVPRLHQSLKVRPVTAKRCPNNSPQGTGLGTGVRCGTAVLRDFC